MSFEAFTDPGQRAGLSRERSARLASTPWSAVEFVTVVFTTTGVDVDIVHNLNPTDPDSVRWIPVSRTASGVIYRDTSGTAKTWTSDRIWLRHANAPATVRLLLFLER